MVEALLFIFGLGLAVSFYANNKKAIDKKKKQINKIW